MDNFHWNDLMKQCNTLLQHYWEDDMHFILLNNILLFYEFLNISWFQDINDNNNNIIIICNQLILEMNNKEKINKKNITKSSTIKSKCKNKENELNINNINNNNENIHDVLDYYQFINENIITVYPSINVTV